MNTHALTRSSLASVASVAIAGLGLVLGACNAVPPTEVLKSGISASVEPAACDGKSYPCGPYGWNVSDVIPNLSWVGRADDNKNGTIDDDSARKIGMAEYFATPGTKAIVLLVAAEWCNPCNQEQGHLVDLWHHYNDMGATVQFVETLIQSTDGSPADLGTVHRWSTKKWTDLDTSKSGLIIPFAVVADPTQVVSQLGVNAFPTWFVVQASDMTIQQSGTGYGKGDSSLQLAIDSVLGN